MAKQAEELIERAVDCLDLRGVPPKLKQDVGYESAIMLKEIFDRIELPPFEEIPDAKAIETEEEQEKVADLTRWRLPNTEIFIEMVEEEGQTEGQFLFSPDTVARLEEFYKEVKELPYVTDRLITHDFLEFYISTPGRLLPPKWSQWLPAWSTAVYYDQTIWQWFALVVLPLAALLVVWLLVRWWHPKAVELSSGKKYTGWILVFLITVVTVSLLRYVLYAQVNITGPLLIFIDRALERVFILVLIGLVVWEVMRGRIRQDIQEEATEEDDFGEEMGPGGSRSETLLLLLRKFFMIAMIVVVCLLFLSSMGINIAPLLAGAGVIGLAIGFGAQTLVKDIISGIFFLMDDAFRVGDYIKTGSVRGSVEHISVRSLRLRHHRGPLITIPFGDIKSVENFSRDYAIMKLDFRVSYDTDVDKVRKIIKKINKQIQKEDEELSKGLMDKIKSQGVKAMDDSAMIMRVKFMTVPGQQFVVRREVYRRIQEAFQKEGIEFAHRNVTVYFPPESDTMESESQGNEKKAESKTPEQKKKEAAAAAALRTIEEEQMDKDKPDEP
jgi:small-conductance mechanosensitive channel